MSIPFKLQKVILRKMGMRLAIKQKVDPVLAVGALDFLDPALSYRENKRLYFEALKKRGIFVEEVMTPREEEEWEDREMDWVLGEMPEYLRPYVERYIEEIKKLREEIKKKKIPPRPPRPTELPICPYCRKALEVIPAGTMIFGIEIPIWYHLYRCVMCGRFFEFHRLKVTEVMPMTIVKRIKPPKIPSEVEEERRFRLAPGVYITERAPIVGLEWIEKHPLFPEFLKDQRYGFYNITPMDYIFLPQEEKHRIRFLFLRWLEQRR